MSEIEHERVVLRRGERSGLTVIVAVHSTLLGSAVGGCRMWRYADWRDGLTDALRLSEAMSFKCAAAGIEHGGGKSVIAVPPDAELSEDRRTAAMRDLGDLVQELDGGYIVGEDVGTTDADMRVVREHTSWAADPDSAAAQSALGEPTSVGVYEAVRATAAHLSATPGLDGLTAAIVGLGNVGAPLARMLAADGVRLVVTDVDESKRALAAELGATWGGPETLFADVDIVVPAALGGILSTETVPRLRCRAVVGPANNQLTDDVVAEQLRTRGIVWAPDFIVNAGGVIWGVATQLDGRTPGDAMAEVRQVGPRLGEVLAHAESTGRTPLAAAHELARVRLAAPVPA